MTDRHSPSPMYVNVGGEKSKSKSTVYHTQDIAYIVIYATLHIVVVEIVSLHSGYAASLCCNGWLRETELVAYSTLTRLLEVEVGIEQLRASA